MFETLFNSTLSDTLSLGSLLINLLSALGLGMAIAFIYWLTHRREGFTGGFLATLIMLPAIIAMVIMFIGNNIARAFSLAGAFSLIRFRSAPGDPKDIAFVFLAVCIGLGAGMGYIGYAVVFTVVLSLALLLLGLVDFRKLQPKSMMLKIIIPEDLNYEGAFDSTLEKYAGVWELKKVRSTDFGTLFELTYLLILKEEGAGKAMIDELRCLNGNLNISLLMREEGEASLTPR